MGDIDVVRICEIPNLLGYATSKAAGNIIMAKYAAELKSEGVKTLSLSPGWVDTETGKQSICMMIVMGECMLTICVYSENGHWFARLGSL